MRVLTDAVEKLLACVQLWRKTIGVLKAEQSMRHGRGGLEVILKWGNCHCMVRILNALVELEVVLK